VTPASWSLTTALRALRAGLLSPAEYLTDLLSHERSVGPLGVYTTRTPERAAARGGATGPLRGIPLVVKDNIDVGGVPTTAATPLLRDHVPRADSAAWGRLAAAGALLLGKTAMHELAYGVTGACTGAPTALNPADPRRLAGGSSSGTAAAVAAGLAPAGLGTDTGGSVRIPAAVCGIAGFRPTTGRYPHRGVLRISPTRDAVGLLARAPEDLLLLDAVLRGGAEPDRPAPRAPRLAVPERGWSGLDAEVDRVATAALAALERGGCALVGTRGWDADLVLDVATAVPAAETPAAVDAYLAATGSTARYEDVVAAVASPDVRRALDRRVGPGRYRAALRAQRALRSWDRVSRRDVTATVTPTTVLPAPPVGTGDHVVLRGEVVTTFHTYIRNTAPAAVLGLPSVTIPAGATADGLPVGLQLDGHPHADTALLRLAVRCSRLLDPRPTTPP